MSKRSSFIDLFKAYGKVLLTLGDSASSTGLAEKVDGA